MSDKKIDKEINISVPVENSENFVPMDCKVCGFLMRDQNDLYSYRQHGSCSDCFSEIVIPNLKKWKEGWRPTKKDMEIIIKKRMCAPSYIIHE